MLYNLTQDRTTLKMPSVNRSNSNAKWILFAVTIYDYYRNCCIKK